MSDRSIDIVDPRQLSRRRIVAIAEDFSRAYAFSRGDLPHKFFTINFEHVYDDFIYPRYGISLEENERLGNSNGEKILGLFDANTNTIVLDEILNDDDDLMSRKKAFTCWHELGHALLHRTWIRTNPGRFSTGIAVTPESGIDLETEDRLERQANLFASHAAAPSWFVDFVLTDTLRLSRPIRYIGPASYWLDVCGMRRQCRVESFHELCRDIAYQIRHRFGGLSITALSYRVRDSRWVINETDSATPPSIPLLRTAPVHFGSALVAV